MHKKWNRNSSVWCTQKKMSDKSFMTFWLKWYNLDTQYCYNWREAAAARKGEQNHPPQGMKYDSSVLTPLLRWLESFFLVPREFVCRLPKALTNMKKGIVRIIIIRFENNFRCQSKILHTHTLSRITCEVKLSVCERESINYMGVY